MLVCRREMEGCSNGSSGGLKRCGGRSRWGQSADGVSLLMLFTSHDKVTMQNMLQTLDKAQYPHSHDSHINYDHLHPHEPSRANAGVCWGFSSYWIALRKLLVIFCIPSAKDFWTGLKRLACSLKTPFIFEEVLVSLQVVQISWYVPLLPHHELEGGRY